MPGGNFTYVNTIPAANDNPSVDQPNMLGNTQSINSWAAQDHFGFNTSGGTNNLGGLHAQVSFGSNNIPGGFSIPTLFTKNDSSSTPQLQFWTGSASKSQNLYAPGSNGSTVSLNGIVFQWGNTGSVANGATITFPQTFPNNCFQVICCVQRSSALSPANVIAYVSSTSTSSWVIGTNLSAGTLLSANWFAIGN